MKRLALALYVPLLVPGLALATSQTHDAAPMVAPAQKPLTDEDLKADRSAPQRTESASAILSRFKAAFPGSSPRMAVFWNRAFDDQVSDWRSNTRGVVSSRGSLNGEVPDGKVNLEGTNQMAAQGEYRNSRRARPDGPVFELQSGLVSQLREAGVAVVDRDAILRITDNDLETGDFSRLSPDQRRLETRALAEHADLLLVFRRLAAERFEIEVLDIDDGRIRAMLSSNGVPPEQDKRRQWRATDQGFQRVERQIEVSEVGRELALQVLADLGASK